MSLLRRGRYLVALVTFNVGLARRSGEVRWGMSVAWGGKRATKVFRGRCKHCYWAANA